jgi:NAD(P)-dependent dehydrogenase (short-subunit alcohol dehydrogenase family)
MAVYDVEGKVALVTGGGSGIGEACARTLAASGAPVAVADLRLGEAERVADSISAAGGRALALEVDVTEPDSVDAMVAGTVEGLGGLAIAVNNAGIGGDQAPTAEQSPGGWRAVLSVNLDGVFYCTRAEIPVMVAAGGGAIVNMASILGAVGWANSVAYTAAKHGVVGLTQTAALEYAGAGVRINAVGPGFINTPLLAANLDRATLALLAGLHPLGRIGTPEEVAALVAWLASDAASFATGTYYPIDGGYLAR